MGLIKLGNTEINNIKLGNTQVKKAYLGNTLIWQSFNKIEDAIGVYSFEKVNQDYTGYCVRIRNEYNNSEQDFGFVDGKVDIDGIKTFLGRNQFLRSEQFESGNWNYKGSINITANDTTDPLSGTTADKLVPTANNNYIAVNNTVPPQINGKQITVSVYAKAGEMDEIWVGGLFGNEATRFNLTSGTIVTEQSNVISSLITDEGSGWWRCSVNYIFQNTIGNNYLYTGFRVATASANSSDGLFVWGAQLDLDGLTDYQATTGVRYGVGRIVKIYDQMETADIIQSTANSQPYLVYDDDGNVYSANFAHDLRITNYFELSGSTGYSLYANIINDTNASSSNKNIVVVAGTIGDNSNLSRLEIRSSSSVVGLHARNGSTIPIAEVYDSTTTTQSTPIKLAGRFATDDFSFYADGTLIGTDSDGTPIDSSNLVIGAFNFSIGKMDGFINEVIIYNQPKNNEYLENLTN